MVNIAAKDRWGNTPLIDALQNKHDKIVLYVTFLRSIAVNILFSKNLNDYSSLHFFPVFIILYSYG